MVNRDRRRDLKRRGKVINNMESDYQTHNARVNKTFRNRATEERNTRKRISYVNRPTTTQLGTRPSSRTEEEKTGAGYRCYLDGGVASGRGHGCTIHQVVLHAAGPC